MKTDGKTKAAADFPPLVALALLLLLLGVLAWMRYGSEITALATWAELNRRPLVFNGVMLAATAAAYGPWLWHVLTPRQSGPLARPRRYKGWPRARPKTQILFWILLVLVFVVTEHFRVAHFRVTAAPLGLDIKWLGMARFFNMLLALCAVLYLPVATFDNWARRRQAMRLKPMPAVRNAVFIGTEEEALEPPRWIGMGEAALKGNLLVTGSIGCGKTQGAILPYLRHVLTRFEPRPAVLAIDPKRMFVRKAKEMVEELGLLDHCLHVRLGGDVRYNPIYRKDLLKGSRSVDIAQMLRAAAINSLGKSGNDSFWDISAFNLIRNGLIYCAAVYGYYTLQDLYAVVVRAAKFDLDGDLKAALGRESFGDEERHNIETAALYFKAEFGAFEQKLKTSVLASATAFLNQFQDFQAARIFSPKETEITLPSIDQAIDQGKIILFDIDNPALARALGTVLKLQFQQSVLERLGSATRDVQRLAVLVIDEYQDVVTSGHGVTLGDDRFLAKGREANAITIAATQSLTSVKNSLRSDDAAYELFQNFRSRIAGATEDLATIRAFQEVSGQTDRERLSRSESETAQDATRGAFTGDVTTSRTKNISAGLTTTTEREFKVKAEHFAELKTFEALARIYDGEQTHLLRLKLKPEFLQDKATPHVRLLEMLRRNLVVLLLGAGVLAGGAGEGRALGTPDICAVVNTPAFDACTQVSVSGCMCPGFPPRPCALITYFRPETFIEAQPRGSASFFRGLPGAGGMLGAAGPGTILPYGAEGEMSSFAYQAHVIDIPAASLVGRFLPCSGGESERPCFAALSEHLGPSWTTGTPDLKQIQFLAGAVSPKACLTLGAAQSLAGGGLDPAAGSGASGCSQNLTATPVFPPSSHLACTGWGPFFPRTGTYEGASQMVGALMAAARIKSLGSEVFQTVDRSPSEKWQVVLPSSSACFLEGQNAGLLEGPAGVSETGRLAGGPPAGFLFAIWRQRSCCRDYPEAAALTGEIQALKAACAGRGPP